MKMFARFTILMTVVGLIVSLPVSVEAANLKIDWGQSILNLEGFPGTVQTASVQFTAPEDYASVDVWVVPELARFIDTAPKGGISAPSSTPIELEMIVSVPADTEPGLYEGTIHVRDGKRTIPSVLKISLSVVSATSQSIPDSIAVPTLDRIREDIDAGAHYIVDEIILAAADGVSQAEISALVESVEGVFIGSIPSLQFYQIRIPGLEDPVALENVVNELRNSYLIASAMRAWLLEPQKVPSAENDPEYENDWDEGNPLSRNANLEYAKFPSAWDITTGVAEVEIAVIDVGFDRQHEDLAGNVGRPVFLNAGAADKEHGTAVAGIIGAVGDNDFGVTGAMWNATMSFYPVGIPYTSIPNTFTLFSALNDAARSDAKVVSMSIGSRFEFDETILDAAKFFIRRILNKDYAKDKLFVFAASNEKNSDVQYSFPANLSSEYGNVMSVTAIGTLDPLGFVPYDEPVAAVGDVDVAAPGVAYTTKPNDTYTRAPLISADIGDGATSFSTPLVSGLAGLLFSLNYDESIDLVEPLTADRVKELIIEGAEDENGGGPQVFGTEIHVINAAKSIELAIEASYPGGGTAVLQPLTGDWAGTNSGNRIEQIFTGVTGVPKSITVYAREWRLRPRGVVISRYAIDTLTVCDNLEDTYGYNEENCFVSQDVGPTADYLVNQAEGSFLSYEFSPAVDVHIRPDQYFRVSLARQTSDSQILEAGGSNSNPIPYSEPQRGIFENPDFDIYFSITTE